MTSDPNLTIIPDALVARFNLICDRLNLKGDSFTSRLELLAHHLEQSPPAPDSSTDQVSLDSAAFQSLCSSQHLLATAIANLTSSSIPTPSIPTHSSSINHTSDSSPQATTSKTSSTPTKKKKARSALPLAHVNYIIDTILDYNNQPQRTHQDKWRIGVSMIKSLTSVNQSHIYHVLKQRQAEIDRHHQLHQLNKSHNQKGYAAQHIHDAIHVIPFHQFKLQF